MKVYVVTGTSGVYSDREDYIVGVFSTREAADAWERAATKYVHDLADFVKDEYYRYRLTSPFDPVRNVEGDVVIGRGYITVGYGRTSYFVTEEEFDPTMPDATFKEPELHNYFKEKKA